MMVVVVVVPIRHWLPKYQRSDVRFDLLDVINRRRSESWFLRVNLPSAGVLLEPGARVELATT